MSPKPNLSVTQWMSPSVTFKISNWTKIYVLNFTSPFFHILRLLFLQLKNIASMWDYTSRHFVRSLKCANCNFCWKVLSPAGHKYTRIFPCQFLCYRFPNTLSSTLIIFYNRITATKQRNSYIKLSNEEKFYSMIAR